MKSSFFYLFYGGSLLILVGEYESLGSDKSSSQMRESRFSCGTCLTSFCVHGDTSNMIYLWKVLIEDLSRSNSI